MINITRHGKAVVQIIPIAKKYEPLDMELMRRVLASLPFDDEPVGDFVRRMRDEDRY